MTEDPNDYSLSPAQIKYLRDLNEKRRTSGFPEIEPEEYGRVLKRPIPPKLDASTTEREDLREAVKDSLYSVVLFWLVSIVLTGVGLIGYALISQAPWVAAALLTVSAIVFALSYLKFRKD